MDTVGTEERFRAAPLRIIRGTTQDWVHVSGTSNGPLTLAVPPGAAAILDGCRSFETLDQHIRTAANRLGGNQSGLGELFANFKRANLLVSEGSLVQSVREADRTGEPRNRWPADLVATGSSASQLEDPPHREVPLSSLSVVTAGRSEHTLRCIRSFLEHNRRVGRTVPVNVFDDHSTGAAAKHFRASLRSLAEDYGTSAGYSGLAEKRCFLEAATRTGLSPAATAFAILGPEEPMPSTTGANRNTFLLHTAGTAAFSADDDVVCHPEHNCTKSTDGIRLYSGFNPLNLWFPKNGNDGPHAPNDLGTDLLHAHESLLGRTPRSLTAGGISPRSSDFSHELFLTVLNGTGRVLATLSGLVGDSGFGTASGYLTMRGELRQRLLQSRAAYESAITNRTIRMVADQPTIAESPFLMAYAFAVDGRGILPPFFPVCRNQDGVFGAILNRLYPPGSTAHVPISIQHQPPNRRTMERDRVWSDAGVTSIADIVIALVGTFQPGPGQPPEARIRALGRHLAALGHLPPAEFLDCLTWHMLQSATVRLARYQSALDAHRGAPDYWAADCLAYIQTLTSAIRSAAWTVPVDLPAASLTQPLIRRYGEVLIEWPDIVAVSRALRDTGVHLAN